MSTERSGEKKLPHQFIGTKLVDRLVVSQIIKEMPRFIQAIPVVFPDDFTTTYANKIHGETKEVVPVIVSSHTAHLDCLPLAGVAKTLTAMINRIGERRLQGFIVPIAASMETGNQGSIVKEGAERIGKITAQQYNLQALSYARAKDKEKYDIPGNPQEFIRDLTGQARNGYGVAVFPESTMQAGRTKKHKLLGKTERFGMQEFKYMEAIAIIIRRTGKVPLYIPVGIDGGFRLESPDNNRPTLPYLGEIFLTHPHHTKLVSVRVGLPISHEEIGSADINDFLGKKVAALLPPEARGVYS